MDQDVPRQNRLSLNLRLSSLQSKRYKGYLKKLTVDCFAKEREMGSNATQMAPQLEPILCTFFSDDLPADMKDLILQENIHLSLIFFLLKLTNNDAFPIVKISSFLQRLKIFDHYSQQHSIFVAFVRMLSPILSSQSLDSLSKMQLSRQPKVAVGLRCQALSATVSHIREFWYRPLSSVPNEAQSKRLSPN